MEQSEAATGASRSSAQAAARPQLHRGMGLREAVALGVGGTIGGGIFVLVGSAAGVAGPGALLAFGVAFLASLAIALPYAELACRFPQAGGGYAFARAVLGPAAALAMGWAFWGAYVFISGYVTLGFGGYLEAVGGPPRIAGACGLVALCTLVNVAGIRVSARAQVAVVAVAVVGLAAFAALGARHVDASRLTPLLPRGGRGVLSAALMAFLAFGGFDMVAAAGEEVRDPERNLPLAIVLTLVVVLVVYCAVAVVALGTVPWDALGRSSAPLRDAAAGFAGAPGAALVSGAALLTTAATANAVLLVCSRIAFAMARDRLLPAALARIDPRTGAPAAAVVLNGILLTLVAASGSVGLSSSVGGFLYVAHFLPSVLAVLLPRRSGEGTPAFRTPARPVTVTFAVGACLVLFAASGRAGAAGGIGWVALGAAVSAAVAARARRRVP